MALVVCVLQLARKVTAAGSASHDLPACRVCLCPYVQVTTVAAPMHKPTLQSRHLMPAPLSDIGHCSCSCPAARPQGRSCCQCWWRWVAAISRCRSRKGDEGDSSNGGGQPAVLVAIQLTASKSLEVLPSGQSSHIP